MKTHNSDIRNATKMLPNLLTACILTFVSMASPTKLAAAPTSPSISEQPHSEGTAIGQTIGFMVQAYGTGPLGFTWRFNGTAIAGATNTWFALDNVQPPNAGVYSVVITNAYGSVTSALANLLVYPQVGQAWTAYYQPTNPPYTTWAEAAALQVDKVGNVYVTGWGANYNGFHAYTTIKYDAGGNQVWIARYHGPRDGVHEFATALAVDQQGNVYVTGTSYGSSGNADYTTIKYNANGVEIWARRYNGPADRDDFPSTLALGSDGSVYVTGSSMSTGGDWDYATVAYSSSGQQNWEDRYDGDGHGDDSAVSLALYTNEYGYEMLYVTGTAVSEYGDKDYTTIGYWGMNGIRDRVIGYGEHTEFPIPSRNDDSASAVAVDGAGDVYVTGTSVNPITAEGKSVTVKHSSEWPYSESWVATSTVNFYGYPQVLPTLALDTSGNVFVTDLRGNLSTIKYNAAGSALWEVSHGRLNQGDLFYYSGVTNITSSAVDSSGNIYVAGSYGGLTYS